MSSTFLYRLNSLTIYSCGMSMWNVEWLHTTIVSMDVETKTTASPPPPLKASDKKRRLSTDHKKVCKKATPAKSGSKGVEQSSLVQAKKPPTYKTVVQLLTMPLREESKTFLNKKGERSHQDLPCLTMPKWAMQGEEPRNMVPEVNGFHQPV